MSTGSITDTAKPIASVTSDNLPRVGFAGKIQGFFVTEAVRHFAALRLPNPFCPQLKLRKDIETIFSALQP